MGLPKAAHSTPTFPIPALQSRNPKTRVLEARPSSSPSSSPPHPELPSPRPSAQMDREGLEQPCWPSARSCAMLSELRNCLAVGRSAPGTLTLRPGFPAGPGGPWMPRGPCNVGRKEKEMLSGKSKTNGPCVGQGSGSVAFTQPPTPHLFSSHLCGRGTAGTEGTARGLV